MSQQNKKNNSLFIFTAIALLAGVGIFAASQYSGSSLTQAFPPTSCLNECSKATEEGEYIYLSLQPNSPEMAKLVDDLTYQIARQAKGNQIFDLDSANGDRTESFYKGKLNRQDLKELRKYYDGDPGTVELEPTESSDRALIESINRLVNLAIANGDERPFRAIIATSGTSNPDTIARIRGICQKLVKSGNTQNVRIYLVGLAPTHRLNTMSAFHPLAANTSSASSSHSEWNKLLRKP